MKEGVTIKQSIIDKYYRYSIRKKVTTRALIVVGTIIALIVFLTYYGTQVGNFVISIKGMYDAGISLYDNSNEKQLTTRLTAKPLSDGIDAAYTDIPNDIGSIDGSHNADDGRYLAYTFYLVNSGTIDCNVRMEMSLTDSRKDINKILRVLIIKDSDNKQDGTVYAAPKDDGTPEAIIPQDVDPTTDYGLTTPFTGNQVVSTDYTDFQVGEVYKFTIVMWLDGWDSDESQDMLGGALKTQVNFSIY